MPGLRARRHPVHRDVTDIDRQLDALDLVRRLDHPRLFENLLSVEQAYSGIDQQLRSPRLAAIDRQPAIGPPLCSCIRAMMSAAQRAVFSLHARPSQEVENFETLARSSSIEFEVVTEMEGGAELEQDDRSVRRHENIASWRMHGPYGHVAGAGRVTDVHRVGRAAHRRSRASRVRLADAQACPGRSCLSSISAMRASRSRPSGEGSIRSSPSVATGERSRAHCPGCGS